MLMSFRVVPTAFVGRLVLFCAGLLAEWGCDPPDAGSVKLPEDLKRSGPMGYGPAPSKGTPSNRGPGNFRPVPAPKKRPGRR